MRLGDSGSVWAGCLQRNFEIISAGWYGSSTTDKTFGMISVSTIASNSGPLYITSNTVISADLNITGTLSVNGSTTLPNNISGNAATATAFQVTPTLCPSGEAPRGIDENGNPVGCDTVGHALEDEGVALSSQPIMNFVGPNFRAYNSGGKTIVEVSSDTPTYIRRVSAALADTSTSSSEFTTITGSTQALNMGSANKVGINLSCNLTCTDYTACPVAFSFFVDGDYLAPHSSDTATGIMKVETEGINNASPEPIVINHITSEISSGTHNFAMLWASLGGVEVNLGDGMDSCTLLYEELPDEIEVVTVPLSEVEVGTITFNKYVVTSLAELQNLACPSLPCMAYGTFWDGGPWNAVSISTGDWKHINSGLTPFD